MTELKYQIGCVFNDDDSCGGRCVKLLPVDRSDPYDDVLNGVVLRTNDKRFRSLDGLPAGALVTISFSDITGRRS